MGRKKGLPVLYNYGLLAASALYVLSASTIYKDDNIFRAMWGSLARPQPRLELTQEMSPLQKAEETMKYAFEISGDSIQDQTMGGYWLRRREVLTHLQGIISGPGLTA